MTADIDAGAAIEIILLKEKKNLFDKTFEIAAWVIAAGRYLAELSNVI